MTDCAISIAVILLGVVAISLMPCECRWVVPARLRDGAIGFFCVQCGKRTNRSKV